MIRNSIHIICLGVIVYCGCLVFAIFKSDNSLPEYKFKILTNHVDVGVHSVKSENTATCDIQTVSYIIQEMKDNGSKIESIKSDNKSLDVILTKDTEKYRLIYTKDRNLFTVAIPYENSYIPLTYINE